MSKRKRSVLGCLCTCVVIAATGVAAVKLGPLAVNAVRGAYEFKQLSETEKAESNEAKQRYDEFIPDKAPDSIIIPEQASPEEKQMLEEEKYYWQVNNKLKEIYNTCFDSLSSDEYITRESLTVKGIFYTKKKESGEVEIRVLYGAIKKVGKVYMSDEVMVLLNIPTDKEFEYTDLLTLLNSNSNSFSFELMGAKPVSEAKLYEASLIVDSGLRSTIEKEGLTPELLAVQDIAMYNNGEVFIEKYIIKLSNEEKCSYYMVVASILGQSLDISAEAYKDILENPEGKLMVTARSKAFFAIDEWPELNKKYNENFAKEETAAFVADEFSTEDGFDYLAYMAAKAQYDAKTPQRPEDESVFMIGDNKTISIEDSRYFQ